MYAMRATATDDPVTTCCGLLLVDKLDCHKNGTGRQSSVAVAH